MHFSELGTHFYTGQTRIRSLQDSQPGRLVVQAGLRLNSVVLGPDHPVEPALPDGGDPLKGLSVNSKARPLIAPDGPGIPEPNL